MSQLRILLFLLFLLPISLLAQVRIIVEQVPATTPIDAELYVAGSFNNWKAGDSNFRLQKNQFGQFYIEFFPTQPLGVFEYKITRGSWASVEGNNQGGFRSNRVLNYNTGGVTQEIEIETWEDLNGGEAASTAAPNVEVLATSFFIPQLNRYRRIWIYLPPDYKTSNRRYPVVYLHDGQNMFDRLTSFSGEWQLDESMNGMFQFGDPGAILVGIDNGGVHRLNEYSPWVNQKYGGGEGDELAAFIVNDLKPFIDREFRTLADPNHTAIVGSSMGGLLALYMAVEYQQVFGRAGIFSPALWFSDEAFQHVYRKGKQKDVRFYLLGGVNEGSDMVGKLQYLHKVLTDVGFNGNSIFLNIHQDGQHSEWYWAREFPGAYQWLFQ
ncbi:MAG: alpha/beta hydrolase-fold protein [Bacteroidota bacterium]